MRLGRAPEIDENRGGNAAMDYTETLTDRPTRRPGEPLASSNPVVLTRRDVHGRRVPG